MPPYAMDRGVRCNCTLGDLRNWLFCVTSITGKQKCMP
jgi:hypothetical protein